MELRPGLSALVTGGGSGIGRALALALAKKGVFVTVVDFSEERGREVESLVKEENSKFHMNLGFPSAIFVQCDVRNSEDLALAFEKHVATYGGMDICINNAGISNPIVFQKDQTDGTRSWRHTINVNLVAVIDSTRLAIKAMEAARKPGVIINLGSASGLYPMFQDPIYSASKGGVVMFTRSLVPYKRRGIRINVLCPEFVQTDLSMKMDSKMIDIVGGFVPIEMVIKGLGEASSISYAFRNFMSLFKSMSYLIKPREKNGAILIIPQKSKWKRSVSNKMGLYPHNATTMAAIDDKSSLSWIHVSVSYARAFELITDESKAGSCLWITNRRGMEYWPGAMEETKYMVPSSSRRKSLNKEKLNLQLPRYFEKIVVHTLTHNFRDATRIVQMPLKLPIDSRHVLVKILYAGVNASDVNFSSGRYFSGGSEEVASRLPFDAGFEAVGIVAAVGDSVKDLTVGTPAALMTYGGYSEFVTVNAKHVLPVPRPEPEVVAMLTSGLTASIALEKAGQMGSGKVVLVTAAAGGTGQFAVQLAKLAGNTVVATCGGKEKAKLLQNLHVNRVIDYKAEDIKTVLKKEFPKGIDIIYESVGGEMLDLCLNALAIHGRLIIIGMISQYQGEHGWKPATYPGLCEKLLAKSQTLSGFFLVQYAHLWQQHLDRLFHLYSKGKLKVALDPRKFLGLNAVADAVEYLHSGKSIGKVVVCIDPSLSQQVARL